MHAIKYKIGETIYYAEPKCETKAAFESGKCDALIQKTQSTFITSFLSGTQEVMFKYLTPIVYKNVITDTFFARADSGKVLFKGPHTDQCENDIYLFDDSPEFYSSEHKAISSSMKDHDVDCAVYRDSIDEFAFLDSENNLVVIEDFLSGASGRDSSEL